MHTHTQKNISYNLDSSLSAFSHGFGHALKLEGVGFVTDSEGSLLKDGALLWVSYELVGVWDAFTKLG